MSVNKDYVVMWVLVVTDVHIAWVYYSLLLYCSLFSNYLLFYLSKNLF